MSDTASLVVRVRADGVAKTAKSLDELTVEAGRASKANDALIEGFRREAKEALSAANSTKALTHELAPATKAMNALSSTSASTAQAIGRVPGAIKGVGPVAQQAGYQLQDMVVQLQMGTSAFVAIGQQVPQFLGALGPVGAVAGTVVALGAAIGGILYKSLGDSTVAAEDLKAASKRLNDALRETENGATVLSDSIIELAEVSERAARAQLASAMADAQTQIRGAQQAAEDAATSVDSFFSSINAAGSLANATSELEAYRAAGRTTEEAIAALGDSTTATYSNLGATANFVGRLSDEFGIGTREAVDLTDALSGITTARTPEALQAAADKAQELSQANGYANVELVKMAANLQKAAIDMRNGSDAAETLKGILNDLGGAFAAAGQEARASAALQIESLRIQTLAGKDQILAQAEFKKKQLEDSKSYNEQELTQAKEYIDRAAQQEIKALDERELAREAREQKSLENQQNRDAKRAASSQRKFDAESEQAQRYLARLEQDNLTEIEIIKVQEEAKIATVAGYREKGLISEQEQQAAITEIHRTALDERVALEEDAMKRLDEANQKLFDEQIRSQKEKEAARQKTIDDGIGAQRDMTGDLKSVLGEQNALYKASAIVTATIQTYQAATGAMAAMSAIPIIGPALGIAAAGAAIAAGMAQVAAISGAREQGGYMSAGSAYQMAERGKAEVIVPAGNSRTKTMSQMKDMMGGSNSGASSIVIVNQTTGRIDSVEQEQDSEGRMILTIKELLVSETYDQSSGFSKARRATRGQPGY